MSPAAPLPCSHDLGPGTTVCLRCRQEERELARARQRRLLTRTGLTIAGFVVAAVLGNAAVNAMRASAKERAREPFQLLASTTVSTVRQQGAPSEAAAQTKAAAPKVVVPNAIASNAVAPNATPAARPVRGLTLMIPVGRTGLRDSMYVERDADSVVVHFDTELGRTRRRDKFENVVRSTLPVLYGVRADSLLAALPEGGITGGRDLVSEMAVRGVRLPISNGGTLELWPVTREGRDGPLVVGYRARVTP